MRSGMRVLRGLTRDRLLTRLVAAYGLFIVCEYALWIVVLVYAYDRGGPTAAGVVAVVQLLPAAVAAPMFAAASDRWSPARVLLVGYLAQAAGALVMTVAAAAALPDLVVYAGAVVTATFVAATRPAQTALLPALTRDVAALTAANVVVGWAESLGIVVAGVLVGVALATGGPAWVFGTAVAALLAAALLVAPIRAAAVASREDLVSPWGDLRQTFTVVRSTPAARVLVTCLGIEYAVVGALDVLFVVLAIGVLGTDSSWAGYLNTAYGIGGVLVGVFAAALIVRRLAPIVLGAALVVGAGLALTAGAHETLVAAALLTVVGGARTMYDVAVRSLLQRAVPAHLVARVFGITEAVMMLALAAGSAVTPVFVATVGERGAVVAVALLMPAVVLIAHHGVMRLDERADVPVVEVALLRSVSLFRDLPAPALEGIARALHRDEIANGTVLIREGDVGDGYYIVADGTAEVTQHGISVRQLHRGDGAGEIALIRHIPRTATVTAASPLIVYRLDREPFLTAVNAHVPTQRHAEDVAAELTR